MFFCEVCTHFLSYSVNTISFSKENLTFCYGRSRVYRHSDTQRHSCTIFLTALVINIVLHLEFKCFRSLTFSVNRNIPQVEVKGTWKFPGSRSVFNLFVGFVPEYFPLFQKSKTKQIENQFEESLNNQETTLCCLSWTPVSSLGAFREMRSSIYSCNIDMLPLVIRFQQILAF